MASGQKAGILQGTLDLMALRTLHILGPQHAYAIAARLEQVSGDLLHLNQGTLYPALVRLEQQGADQGDLGQNGGQPRSQVLRHYQIRRESPRRGDPALAANHRADGKNSFRGSVMRRWISRAANLLRWRAAEREMRREIASHLALLQEEFERRGLSPEEAALTARRAMGGAGRAQELHREARSFGWVEQFFRDLLHGARNLRRRDSRFSLFCAVALGTGVNATIFGLYNAIVWKRAAYRGPRIPARTLV